MCAPGRELGTAQTRLEEARAGRAPGAAREPGVATGSGPAPASKLAQRIAAELPWLPVPAADLALLGKDRESWIASKVGCGLLGLAFPPLLAGLASLAGTGVARSGPAFLLRVCTADLFF